MAEITYTTIGDYQYPDIEVEEQTPCEMKKYSVMRLEYLKSKKRGIYIRLLMSCELADHLTKIQTRAEEMMDTLIAQMVKLENVTDALVGAMNNIRNRAEEVVLAEIVYQ